MLVLCLPLLSVKTGMSNDTSTATKENVPGDARHEPPENDAPEAPTKPDLKKVTLKNLKTILEEATTNLKGVNGRWTFSFEDVSMALVADEEHDRMRIVAPVVEIEHLQTMHYKKMLEANFHTALDTRYAISDGIVYAAFIHPLSPLRDTQFASALMQVANLAKTFGTTYSSGALSYLGANTKQ